jgi:glyoxylase-like metal-dependent hydrolase (beta-lactamase superfamily II)
LDESRSILLAGDHLIKHISSNPLLARPLKAEDDHADRSAEPATGERPRALVTYIASLEKTRAMELSLVLPGHGEPILDHVSLIDERFRLHRRRAAKIHRLIASEPRTAHEIAHELWGNVAVTQAFLTLSEVLGHVDLLLADGLVQEQERDGVVRFQSS